jgi:hypothetical protein
VSLLCRVSKRLEGTYVAKTLIWSRPRQQIQPIVNSDARWPNKYIARITIEGRVYVLENASDVHLYATLYGNFSCPSELRMIVPMSSSTFLASLDLLELLPAKHNY